MVAWMYVSVPVTVPYYLGAESVIELVAGGDSALAVDHRVPSGKSCSGQVSREDFVMGFGDRFAVARGLHRCRIHC